MKPLPGGRGGGGGRGSRMGGGRRDGWQAEVIGQDRWVHGGGVEGRRGRERRA